MAGMSGPIWLADVFAGTMALTVCYSAARLVVPHLWSRRSHRDVDITHVLMGVAMAGMLASPLNFVPSGLWEVIFAALALWFIWRCWVFAAERGLKGLDEDHVHHLSHYVTHVVMAFAMLYMYLAAGTSVGGAGDTGMAVSGASGTGSDFVGLPLLFLVLLLASGIWELDRAEQCVPSGCKEEPSPHTLAAVGKSASLARNATVLSLTGNDGAYASQTDSAAWLAPGLEAATHIAMCATMAYMLVVML